MLTVVCLRLIKLKRRIQLILKQLSLMNTGCCDHVTESQRRVEAATIRTQKQPEQVSWARPTTYCQHHRWRSYRSRCGKPMEIKARVTTKQNSKLSNSKRTINHEWKENFWPHQSLKTKLAAKSHISFFPSVGRTHPRISDDYHYH